MKIKKHQPDLYIYNQEGKKYIGKVINPHEMVIDYNFNAASKITFSVNKKIYDERIGKWIKNPCYDDLTEHMVIVTSDTENKIKFKGKPLLTTEVNGETVYDYGGLTTQPNPRNVYATGLGFNVKLKNATLQNEIELFDIGKSSGYTWDYYAFLNSNGEFRQDTKTEVSGGYPRYYSKIACSNFFPVEVGDIIAIGAQIGSQGYYQKGGTPYYEEYFLCFYSSNEAPTCIQTLSPSEPAPISRLKVSEGYFGTSPDTGEKEKSGYVRICANVPGATYNINTKAWTSHSPSAGFVKIYSGERRCTGFTCGSQQTVYVYNNKWIVQSIEETKDKNGAKKAVTLYSYEYVLSQRCFSIDESTLPLFIPDEIPNYVNSSNCVVDAIAEYSNGAIVDGTYNQWTHKQRMGRGLLNQILDYLPDWKIGFVNPKVCIRYRTISEMDNDNIYAFLINTVQPLYKCFFIFDNVNKTINILDISDICGIDSGAILSWSNAIKSIDISSIDTNYITALRVHTADDTYGLGLINPTGNNVIYNFDSVIDSLNFSADSTHFNPDNEEYAYTLKQLILRFQDELSRVKNGTLQFFNQAASNSYPNLISDLVDYTKKYVELSSKLSEALANYRAIGEQINIYLANFPGTNTYPVAYQLISDYPRSPDSMKGNGDYRPIYNASTNNYYDNYSSETLYTKLLAASEAYWETYRNHASAKQRLSTVKWYLKLYATYFSLNYKTVSDDWKRYNQINTPSSRIPPIFTPKEILALNSYIYEGDWANENAIFKDNYEKGDIIDTLKETMEYASEDLEKIYSKPNYEFKINSTNIFADKNLSEMAENIYIGNSLTIADNEKWIFPILLGVHIDYSNEVNFSLTLTTDYKRKPLDVRFSELFGTISQVSPSTASLTYDG